jgi:hypothetical protein
LATRFGIEPKRAKVAIWAQQHFLEEVFPEMTPEILRLAYEVDKEYENVVPSQDYGLDLEIMEQMYLGEERQFYPNKLISKNPKIFRQEMKIKKLQELHNPTPKSAILEESLFGKKLSNEEQLGVISPRKVEIFKNRNNALIQRLKNADESYKIYSKNENNFEKILRPKVQSRRGKDHFVVERIMGFSSGQYWMKNWIVNKGKGTMRVNKMFKRVIQQSHRPDYLPKKVLERNRKYGPRKAALGYGVVH